MNTPSKVRFIKKASIDQIRWGSNDDPNDLLEVGKVYDVEDWEVHSWHTKVILVDFPGKRFNSVNFEEVD